MSFRFVLPVPRLGRVQFNAPQPVSATVSEGKPVCSVFRLPLACALKPGWYMLEVVHGNRSIGADLSLGIGPGSRAHLQLRGRPLVKRIVRFFTHRREIELSIDVPDARIERLTLIAVSPGFARQRMRAKLTARGEDGLAEGVSLTEGQATSFSDTRLQALYTTYERYLCRHLKPCDAWIESVTNDKGDSTFEPIEAEGSCGVAGNPISTTTNPLRILIFCESFKSVKTLSDATADWGHLNIAVRVVPMVSAEGGRIVIPDGNTTNLVAFVAADVTLLLDEVLQMLQLCNRDKLLCYADHMECDSAGKPFAPQLKPVWNPDLLRSINYIGGFFVCRQDWLQTAYEAGDLPRFTAEAVLALAGATLTGDEVQHIPLRAFQATAGSRSLDWHCHVREALARHHPEVSVCPGLLPHTAHVVWPLPQPLPTVDIIIPTRDRAALLQRCVESILQGTDYDSLRIVIVDNDSVNAETHLCFHTLLCDERVSILKVSGRFNYSALNNQAVARSNADVIVLLNNDTEVLHADWLSEMVRHAIRPDIGCVGAKLYYSNGRVQHAGVVVGIAGVAGHVHRYAKREANGYMDRLKVVQNMSAVTGACLAVERRIYDQVNGLDEQNLPVSYNDVDFCLRVQEAGYRNLWTPHAELYHHESVSRGSDQTRRTRRQAQQESSYMMRRWSMKDHEDPAYHRDLTHVHEDFGPR